MSPAEAQEVRSLLLRDDPTYRELAQRHHQLDHKLHTFTDRYYLTDSEQVEEVTLKKLKLAVKDQMERIAREYVQAHGSAS